MVVATLADWSPADLQRFVEGVLRANPANLPTSLTAKHLTTTGILNVSNELQLSPQAVTYLHQVLGV